MVIFCLKRRKDRLKAEADLNQIEMMQNKATDTHKKQVQNSNENISGTRKAIIPGANAEGFNMDDSNADEINSRGTHDSVQSATVSNTSHQQPTVQILQNNYCQVVSMQQPEPGSFPYSVPQNYSDLSYPNSYSYGTYQNPLNVNLSKMSAVSTDDIMNIGIPPSMIITVYNANE